jgi:hypothetical protein
LEARGRTVKCHTDMETLVKKIIYLVFFAALAFASAGATAQVYQWKDPSSGTTRFSNSAPPWFRAASGGLGGPRIQVYYYGYLIDDTGLSYDDRVALRAQTVYARLLPPLLAPGSQQVRR